MIYKGLSGILLENYNLIILKNKNKPNIIYTCIYNKNFLIMIKDTLKNNKKFIINNKNYINFSILLNLTKYFSKDLFSFLNQFYKYKYFKVRFVGKGYKIKKKKKIFFLLFNRSHRTRIWWRHIFFKKFKKYKMYLKGTYFCNALSHNLLKIRKINIFTKKGLRLTRQKKFKKKGKK